VTGLEVWQSPIANGKDKPTGDYITFQVVSVVSSDYHQVNGEVKDADFITKSVSNNARILVSFNAFAYKGYQALAALNASETFWQHRNTLAADGVSIQKLGNPQNLTGLGDTNFVDRWQMDVEFNVDLVTQYDWDRIKQIQLAGRFLRVDDTGEVVSVVKWPLV
jgi:hypothetical protein